MAIRTSQERSATHRLWRAAAILVAAASSLVVLALTAAWLAGCVLLILDVHKTPAERRAAAREERELRCWVLGGSAERWIDGDGTLAISANEAALLSWSLDDDESEEAAAVALRARLAGPRPLTGAERHALQSVATWQRTHCDGVERRAPLP